MIGALWRWAYRHLDTVLPRRKVVVADSDALPLKLPRRDLVVVRDDGEDWSVGLQCPCGCRRRVELLLVEEATPRWDLTVDSRGIPTLRPSVWLKGGCKSHFFIVEGRVRWCP